MNAVEMRMKALLSLKTLYPNLVSYDNRTAMLEQLQGGWSIKITILERSVQYDLINKGKTFDMESKEIPQEVRAVLAKLLNDFGGALRELLDQGEEPDPIENLKEGGFDLSDVPVSPERENKEAWDEVKKQEEKKARIEREANQRKLEMAEEVEMLEEAQRVQHQTLPQNNVQERTELFTDRPVEYVDIPAAKTGEVNLYDVLNKICKHDLMQVFGNTGTGKTSLCTKLALDARAKGKSVLYIDTEGSINDDQIEAMKKTGTKYEFIKQFQKLCEFVKRLPKVNVLIVDSAGVPALAAYCKSNLGGQGEILKKFIAMSDDLKTYATDNNSLVVVINQPESSMSKGENAILEPFGEKSRYYYKEILKTNYAKRGRITNKTTLVLSAHRSRCMGIDTPICTMEVTNDGVKVIQ